MQQKDAVVQGDRADVFRYAKAQRKRCDADAAAGVWESDEVRQTRPA